VSQIEHKIEAKAKDFIVKEEKILEKKLMDAEHNFETKIRQDVAAEVNTLETKVVQGALPR